MSLNGDPDCDLPALVVAECRDKLAQIAETSERISGKAMTLKSLVAQTDRECRLRTMLGVGLITALAIEAFAPEMTELSCGRGFAV